MNNSSHTLLRSAYFAGWGSFFTAPGAFERGPWSNSRFGRWFPRPLFINIVCFGTPVLLMGSLAPVIVLGQRQLSRSYVSYQAFSAVALAAANAGSTVDPATTRLLLQGASAVWRENMLYIWYMSLGWIIWPIFASLFLIFYIPAVSRSFKALHVKPYLTPHHTGWLPALASLQPATAAAKVTKGH